MKRIVLGAFLILLFCGHDMFLKMDDYFLEPHTEATILLYNGTFDQSDNVITRDRMIDVSLSGNNQRISVDSSQWYEKDNVTLLDFNSGHPGTWVAGVSTLPRIIDLEAEAFNNYLVHDGVLDMLELRRERNALEQDAVEKYSKHVKTIFQVGDELSEDWKSILGYPIEFVPLENPFDLHPGHSLGFKLLFKGSPLPNQLVYVDHEASNGSHSHDGHTHTHDDKHVHQDDSTNLLRTDDQGIVRIDINATGVWYLRTIHMALSEAEGLTHESNWATVTFGIGEGHTHLHAVDDHSHEEEEGIPGYIYWVASILFVIVLFFWFNRKK